jgi:hypothetical protein
VNRRDFFISFASPDREWAEWIATRLERRGYSTVYQSADFRAGSNFLHEMHEAVDNADRLIAVLSPDYLRSDYCEAEWQAFFARDRNGRRGLIIPVRVRSCKPTGLLAARVYADLVGSPDEVARKKLLAAVDKNRSRPVDATYPGFPSLPGQPKPLARISAFLLAGALMSLSGRGVPDAVMAQPDVSPARKEDPAKVTIGNEVARMINDRDSGAPSRSLDRAEAGGKDHLLLDLDERPPRPSRRDPEGDVPGGADVGRGADTMYSLNGAHIWAHAGSEPCRAGVRQAIDGGGEFLNLPVQACVLTTRRHLFALKVTAAGVAWQDQGAS